MYHYIIVGQGIAGTMLAWNLIRSGKKVLVIDAATNTNASFAASGIINPITGKRFVKSWLINELLAEATGSYAAMQEAFAETFFRTIDIYHILNSNEEVNDWSAKANTDGYRQFLTSGSIIHLDSAKVNNSFGCFTVGGGCKVETNLLLLAARQWLQTQDAFYAHRFDVAQLVEAPDHVRYGDYTAEAIIFANGHHATALPFFQPIPFVPVKGEGLLIEVPDFYTDHIVHGDVMISPTQKPHVYYVGSTYQWDYPDALPTAAKREELEQRIKKTIAAPFTVLQHVAGIRPATNDRRPVIGMLKGHPRIGIFNGMGTKGFSLAPYFAAHFCHHLLQRSALMPAADVNRFY